MNSILLSWQAKSHNCVKRSQAKLFHWQESIEGLTAFHPRVGEKSIRTQERIIQKIHSVTSDIGVRTPIEAQLGEGEACVLAWGLSLLTIHGDFEVSPAQISLARVSRPTSPGNINVFEIGLAEILAGGEMVLASKQPPGRRVVYGNSPVVLPLRT